MSGIKTVAITRPQEEAEKLAAELQAKGYKTYIVPMLRIELNNDSVPTLEQAFTNELPALICVTSRHAVRTLARQPGGRSVPVCAVGAATAEEARKAGFLNVTDTGGNADALCEYITKNIKPEGNILYPRGKHVAKDIASTLAAEGFFVTEVITYTAHVITSFPAEYCAALRADEIDAILFFSQQTGLLQQHTNCIAIGDDSIREALRPLPITLKHSLA
jgi:uroporphyrinogen-III synthase